MRAQTAPAIQQPILQPGKLTGLRFGSLAWTARDAADLKTQLKNNQVLFWDVDTQKGFMWPIANTPIGNAIKRIGLYVDGALKIRPNLKTLTRLHEQFRIPLVATMDSHSENDPEFRHFTAVSDEHCKKGAPDWAKIPETTPFGLPRHIEVSPEIQDTPTLDEVKTLFQQGRSIVVEKNTISAFQHRVGETAEQERFEPNRKAIDLVHHAKQLGIKTAVVYGVATDFCVKAAVEGLQKLGIRPIVVNDAIRGVFTNNIDDPANEELYNAYKDVTTVSTRALKKTVQEALQQASA